MMPGGTAKATPINAIRSFKKGGAVKKTGIYKLHKGEHVISKKMKKLMGFK